MFNRSRLGWKLLVIVFFLIFGVALGSLFIWFRFFSTEQFRNAMERGDYLRAEQLWKWGIYAPEGEPYTDLMSRIQRLRAYEGTEVLAYGVDESRLSGYLAFIIIRRPNTEYPYPFQIMLVWKDNKWNLRGDYKLLSEDLKNIIERKGGNP